MQQLANYIVTHARSGSRPGQLAEFRLLERQGDQFEDRGLLTRAEVIELLDSGERIFAWDYEGEDLGDEVELVRVQGDQFVRIDGQRLRADHLGDLPEPGE
ncbi:hypothetical protein FIV42_05695 [Persicimonas caeni]|uniref:DUF3892 domain-containing protein n=1 Tax=Persicimonas caeni TaxID=2292766 RepID=A0A4Y6PPP3_PERCE|nr:hypothetical protein [Persicimonas caeni]QDG50240.1 hypothetical protein FIV42_05695 [Persicimonas caeni]QED31461.1 hypothetical protein FRD00_05690 [Persicimonas caeni]